MRESIVVVEIGGGRVRLGIDAPADVVVDRQEVYEAKREEKASEGDMKTKLATGIELIAAERKRQIEVKGWSPEHDDEFTSGALAEAAACYAVDKPIYCERRSATDDSNDLANIYFQNVWPFDSHWYKRKDRITDLVRAGALIAAEIDRLQRLRASAK